MRTRRIALALTAVTRAYARAAVKNDKLAVTAMPGGPGTLKLTPEEA